MGRMPWGSGRGFRRAVGRTQEEHSLLGKYSLRTGLWRSWRVPGRHNVTIDLRGEPDSGEVLVFPGVARSTWP